MPDGHDQHYETVVLDGGDDPVIADAVAPEPLAVSGQRMAKATWILAAGDALAQIAQDASLPVSTEFAQVVNGCAMKLDPPDRRGYPRFVRLLRRCSRLSRLTRGPPRAKRRRAR